MSEHVSNPFLAYNSTGNVKTLIGNWQEEACLKSVTGCSRTQAVASQLQPAEATVYAVKQDVAVHEPTHSRVVEHTEQLYPGEWLTSNRVNYQAPQARTHDLASYTHTSQPGPREQQELRRLLQEAAVKEPEAAVPATYETTSRATYHQHSLVGANVGARVMKTQDGEPVQRDPTFLAETQIVQKAAADRLMAGSRNDCPSTLIASSSNYPTMESASCTGDLSVPITIYSEAAAKSTFTGQFYGTATGCKLHPMNRNDNFTKLLSDFNKCTDDQLGSRKHWSDRG